MCSVDSRIYSTHKGHSHSTRMAAQPLKETDRRCTQDTKDPRGQARLGVLAFTVVLSRA